MKILLAAWLLANSADVVTTELALQHPRAYEANILLRHPVGRWTIKPAMTAAVAVTVKRHYRQMNKRQRACVWIGSGILTAASIHNYRIYQRRGETR